MEAASLAFSVPGDEERESEEENEEEERQRKQELHQLLTDQLQDDLLDDSVSTATTEGANSTILGDEVGVAFDHVISPNQSCDVGVSGGSGSGGGGVGEDSKQRISHVFSGTAQAYSLLPPAPISPPPPTTITTNTAGNYQVTIEKEGGVREGGRGGGGQSEMSQLQILYGARCRQVTELTQQLVRAREEGERKERVLNHQLSQLQSNLKQQEVNYEQQIKQLSQQLHETTAALEKTRTERNETCAMIHPPAETGEDAKRIIEISAEKEDLQYQLSCCQGQLEVLTQRALTSEEEVGNITARLKEAEKEVDDLRSNIVLLEEEKEKEKENFENEKREALEKCRAVCLQLHETSTLRLRESVAEEKESLLSHHREQLSALQEQLSSVQQDYILISEEKIKMETNHKTIMEQKERKWREKLDELATAEREAVKLAVETTRDEWRQAVAMESQRSVEKAIISTRQQWQSRLEQEKEIIRIEKEKEKQEAVRHAMESAHQQWQATHKEDMKKAIEEVKKERISLDEVQSLLQTTILAVKRDVRKMMNEVVEDGRERELKAVAECRLVTAQEMRAHYLNCLHTMVNSTPPPPPRTQQDIETNNKLPAAAARPGKTSVGSGGKKTTEIRQRSRKQKK